MNIAHNCKPTKCGNAFMQFWEYFFKMGRLLSRQYEVARCASCGKYLFPPRIYKKLTITNFLPVHILSGLLGAFVRIQVDQKLNIQSTNFQTGYLVGLVCALLLTWIIIRVTIAMIFLLAPWEVVGPATNIDEAFWQQSQENASNRRHKRGAGLHFVLVYCYYALFDLFLF